jgi:hypothetical protein
MAEKKDTEPQAEGVTTRDDANDLGVPMLAGSSDEPTGPEDALGEGPKRGDYSDRIGPSNYQPHRPRWSRARRGLLSVRAPLRSARSPAARVAWTPPKAERSCSRRSMTSRRT